KYVIFRFLFPTKRHAILFAGCDLPSLIFYYCHIPKYLIFFIVCNPITLSNSIFCNSCKFFVKSFMFYLLIFRAATSPYLSSSLIISFPVSIRSSIKNTMLSAKACNLYSSFLILSPFIPGFCLICLNKVSSDNIKSRGERGQPCLTPFRISKLWVFSPLTIIFAFWVEYIVIMFSNLVPRFIL
uniref:Uncharacterized protein n=1 Tax=Laticauda laticaudata TaxID=8630 RepID=A0A8C5WXH2_LATLA